ncbi:protein AAR2 homolog isoform X2 [Mytilus edulis]
MDQDTAQTLFKEGAIFVFLDVPVGTEFGIDYNSWNVGPEFRGVKMIPAGLHFVYYSACNKEGQTAPRTGFFYNFRKKEIVVRKWNRLLEDIDPDIDVRGDMLQKFHDNKEEMDRYLGAYPYENYKKWVSLSSCMSESLVEKLQPENGKILSVSEFISESSDTASRKKANDNQPDKSFIEPTSAREAESQLPQMKVQPGTFIRFTELPKKRYPEGSTPAEITKCSMDSTYILETLLKENLNSIEKDLLGEVQFSFICFLIGQVFDGFDQWKKLVHLLCSSESALTNHTQLFLDFIGVLYFQVHEIPEDFFVDIVSQSNFLTTTLQEFFSNVDCSSADQSLKRKCRKFKEHLTSKFRWDFDSEPDEYAPVVVETN